MLKDFALLLQDLRFVLSVALLDIFARLVQLQYLLGLHKFNCPFLASFTDLWRYWDVRIH
jgi:hypothetical protein